ncbi:MAG TPA: hypothetical protein VGB08_02395 [Allosphingosinicella sp.]
MLLTACFGMDRVHYEQLTGPYYLKANDMHEAMFLVRQSKPDEHYEVAGPGVMRAGFDNRYIVVAVDPLVFESPGQRRPREYYYVDRAVNEADRYAEAGIVGPLTFDGFNQHDRRLGLPDFSWSNDGP